MNELIKKEVLLRMLNRIIDKAEVINTSDALELYVFLDACNLSINDLKRKLTIQLWKDYVKYNPEIDSKEYHKKLRNELLKKGSD